MDTPTPEMGAATPDGTQLPKGSRQQLQQSTQQAGQLDQQVQQATTAPVQPAGPQMASGLPGAPPLGPVQQATPETGPVHLGDEEDGLLYGPTNKPQEHVTSGAGVLTSPRASVPPNIGTWLPALRLAAQDPTADPMFKNMLNLIVYHMNETTGAS